MGQIPDGLYGIIGDAIRLLAGPQRTVEQLRQLQRVVEEVRAASAAPSAVLARAKVEHPEFSQVLEWLKTHHYLTAWLSVVLALVLGKCGATPTHATIENVINVTVQQQVAAFQPRESQQPRPPVRPAAHKVGRNDPCPCGSAKKFKKCCGVVQ